MTVCIHHSHLSSSRTRPATIRLAIRHFALSLVHLVALPIRAVKARAMMSELAQLNVHELKDIGLSRQDIEAANALSLGEDPTRLLQKRISERRGDHSAKAPCVRS